MKSHWSEHYWDRGVRNVPDMTGARAVMDASDLKTLCAEFGITLPMKIVLDVGCGTGRASQLCDGYVGVDVSPSMVQYSQAKGLTASLISGHEDLPTGPFDLILCISVFTHIPREERIQYLQEFAKRSNRLLVDIIPGDGKGSVALWTADPAAFAADLLASGWIYGKAVDQCWDAAPVKTQHQYYYCWRNN